MMAGFFALVVPHCLLISAARLSADALPGPSLEVQGLDLDWKGGKTLSVDLSSIVTRSQLKKISLSCHRTYV